MKIRVIKEGAEEVGASLGRGIDQMVAQIKMLHQPAIDQIIKALGGHTKADYNKLNQRFSDYMKVYRPSEDDPDFGAAQGNTLFSLPLK